MEKSETKKSNNPQTIIGIIVIIIGSLFLLSNFGMISYDYIGIIFKWQSIIIIIGAITYFSSNSKSFGVTIIAIGILGFVPNFWALLLVGVGVYIIYKNKNSSKDVSDYDTPESKSQSDYINDISIFVGGRKIFNVDNFRGGNITAIFGGSEINFTDSNLCDGLNTLNLFVMLGGVNIRIPSNWNVINNVTPILGEMKDKRVVITDENSNKKLIIKGVVILGECELL